MKLLDPMSKTAQRGYLYLALIVVIVLVIVCWPAPKADTNTQATDSLAATSSEGELDSNNSNQTKRTTRNYRRGRGHSPSPDTKRDSSYNEEIDQPLINETPYGRPNERREVPTIDLNSADTLTLQLLHGIGPTYARRIVKYRDRIGGFVSKEQLLEVYGMTPELYAHIAPHLTLSDTHAVRKIKINGVDIKQLIKNPYLDYYQARDIIAWRNQGHHYNNAEDLRLVSTIDDSTLARLLPYLEFE